MKPTRWLLLVAAWAIAAGCSEDGADADAPADAGDASPIDDAATDALPSCESEQAALIGFVRANKACAVDADCVHVGSRADIREHCSGGFYLAAGYDSVAFSGLEAKVAACLGPETEVCAAVPPNPMCWRGTCTPSGYDITTRETCLSLNGGETPCTLCVCGPCVPMCTFYEECRALLGCAMAAGCVGTSCQPDSPDFPCKAQLDAAGEQKAELAKQYEHTVQCLADWQCLDACKNAS